MHRLCSRMVRIAAVTAALAVPLAAGARTAEASTASAADRPDTGAPADPAAKPDRSGGSARLADSKAGDRARAQLDSIVTSGSGSARLAAAAALATLGEGATPALIELLDRPRRSSEDERREVLRTIQADIPDEEGRFASARRRSRKRDAAPEVITRDDYDWLAALAELDPGLPGLGETMADVALIRALAASQQIAAAEAILDFAFDEVGMMYRDEAGRYLRRMAPYSLPTLIEASDDRKRQAAQRRYAGYQLDRLDRRIPSKALDHASVDEDLKVAVLDAYGQGKPREAVGAVLAATNDTAPRVRQAARRAWLAYVTGPEPPPAPKRKLQLPGGKLTDEEEPLWLNYRELAVEELQRVYEQVLGERPPRRASLEKISNLLFAYYDAQRAERLALEYREAAALAAAGDWPAAAAAYDLVLAQSPDHPERAAMAPAYFEYGKALEKEGAWREASAAYSKAHGLDPKGEHAAQALAGHYFTLGKVLQAEGKDGTGAFRRAAALDPARAGGEAGGGSADGGPTASRGRWMLYAGLGGGAGALILFIVGMALRRR